MKKEITYYHVPAWMSILIDGLIKERLACKIKNSGKNKKGLYRFPASYGEEESREEILIVWNAPPESVELYLQKHLPTDVEMLVSMAEGYARDRNGREETKVHRGILQLLIARATELLGKRDINKTLVVNGDFTLIGRLSPLGKLRINGKVKRVEGWTGELLEIKCKKCPEMQFDGMATQREGVWQITRRRMI